MKNCDRSAAKFVEYTQIDRNAVKINSGVNGSK